LPISINDVVIEQMASEGETIRDIAIGADRWSV
jgi:hypothetical protein